MIETEHNSVQLQTQDWDSSDEYATKLHLAMKDNNLRYVQRLIGEGLHVLSVDKFGRTPLHWALVFGYQKVACALIINTPRSGLDCQDKYGCTPLHYAALGGRTDVGRILLERGALINPVDSKKRTPLHYAAQSGRPDMVEMLVSRGANKNCLDYKGFLPCDIAVEWGSFSSLVCLRQNSFLKSDKTSECKDLEHVGCSKVKIESQQNNNMSENKDVMEDGPGVNKKRSPSLDKLMLAWKNIQNNAKMKKESEAKLIAKTAKMLEIKLQQWREAEQECKLRRHEGWGLICDCSVAMRSWRNQGLDQTDRSRTFQTSKDAEGLAEASTTLLHHNNSFVSTSSPFYESQELTSHCPKDTLDSGLVYPKSHDLAPLNVGSIGSSTPTLELGQADYEQDKNLVHDPSSTVQSPIHPSNRLVSQYSTSLTTFKPSNPAMLMSDTVWRGHDRLWWCRETNENFPAIQQSEEAPSSSVLDANDALRWCTEWDVDIPEISTRRADLQRCREMQQSLSNTSQESALVHKLKGKEKAFFEEEPTWVQVWPKPSSSSTMSKTNMLSM